MLYEPPKTKRYIFIGAGVVVLAVLLVVVFSVVNKNKTTQIPTESTAVQEKVKQEKVHEEFKKLNEMNKSEKNNAPAPTPTNIQTELKKLDEAKAKSKVTPPTQADIQKQLDLLNKAK
jgi:predicted negative regulator of RcsB-dependent stress response